MGTVSISIVTPSFNHARFIGAAIGSVLQQEAQGLRYVVMDGGSSDGTVEILKQFGSRIDWVSEKDRGQADAINRGFGRAPGEILGWLNSDDMYAPGALAWVAKFFARHPEVGVVYGKADFIDAAGKFIGHCQHIENFSAHRLLHYSDFIVQPAAFFRREVYVKAGGLDGALNWAMDYDFWLKASRIARFAFVPRVLAHYRWLGESKTAGGGAARLEEVERVARRYGAGGLPAFFRLEVVRMKLAEAIAHGRGGKVDLSLGRIASAAADIGLSPRAMGSLLSAKTWRIIAMGRTLRKAAARCAPAGNDH